MTTPPRPPYAGDGSSEHHGDARAPGRPPEPGASPDRPDAADQAESLASHTAPAGDTEGPAEPQSVPPRGPQSLLAAVKLMYVGAGLQSLSIAYTFAARVQLRDQIAAQEPALTSAEVDSALNFHLMSVAIIDVLAIAMWIWMAQVNRAGFEWARIVASVLAPLNIAFTLFSLTQAVGAMVVGRLVIIALSAAILFLLYRPDSTRYYRAVANHARR